VKDAFEIALFSGAFEQFFRLDKTEYANAPIKANPCLQSGPRLYRVHKTGDNSQVPGNGWLAYSA